MLLPRPGDLVSLRVEGEQESLPCVVDQVLEDRIVLAPSVGRQPDVLSLSRATALIEWATRRGRARLAGTIHPDGRGSALVLEPAADPEIVQQRQHVRAMSHAPVQVHWTGRVLRASLVDVSGAGARVRLESGTLPLDAQVRITVELPEEDPVEALGHVAQEYGGGTYGLRFESIPDPDRDRLIHHVFEQLRLEAKLR